jgi:hypothetical protein
MTRFVLPLVFGALLTACGDDPDPASDKPSGDDTAAPSGPDDTADPDDTGDPEPPGSAWTTGPDLPDCTPTEGSGSHVALSGVVLTLDGAVAGHVVYSADDGRILCAGEDCDTSGATIICTEGVISPGLIDSHNHMQYNVLGPWQHSDLFGDRYEWRSAGDYWDYRTAYDELGWDYSCEVMKWAEARTLVGGGTSVVGSSSGGCIDGLIRNLDEGEDAHGISDYSLYYSAGTVTSSFDEGDVLVAGEDYSTIENHVAEGIQGRVRNELSHMADIGMDGPGQIYVHATDATTAQLAQMADAGTALAWSPRSNLDLYGDTTQADVAHRLGMDLTLGPDWTWSGSLNPAREMACAHTWLDSRGSQIDDITIWSWTTSEAARVLGLDSSLGALEPGLQADIAVFAWSSTPYRAVIESGPKDTTLVIVGGQTIYGTPETVAQLATTPDWCETVSACGVERSICVQTEATGWHSDTLQSVEDTLSAALGAVSMPTGLEYAGELFGLWMCEETRASCDLRTPADGDTDGDGIQDGEDKCPDAYDPLQSDHDKDGQGDVCDPCPLDATSDDCTHTPGDIDGDGIPTEDDVCPWIADTDQEDRDGDGSGDACDLCPDEYSTGDDACTFTLSSLRNPDDPLHPPEGTDVRVDDLVVVGIRSGSGFYVQDPTTDAYGGIFVYDSGANSVTVGQLIDVVGVYVEYHTLSEIKDPTIFDKGTADLPAPQVAADACDVATDGVSAEAWESMRVEVQDLSVTDANPDAPEDYGEFEVNSCLRVDDQLTDVLVPQPAVDTTFSTLRGVLTYSYGHHKLEPGGADDILD